MVLMRGYLTVLQKLPKFEKSGEIPGGGCLRMLKLYGLTHSNAKIENAAPCMETNRIITQVEYSKGSENSKFFVSFSFFLLRNVCSTNLSGFFLIIEHKTFWARVRPINDENIATEDRLGGNDGRSKNRMLRKT